MMCFGCSCTLIKYMFQVDIFKRRQALWVRFSCPMTIAPFAKDKLGARIPQTPLRVYPRPMSQH
jgi:hypothetical protein